MHVGLAGDGGDSEQMSDSPKSSSPMRGASPVRSPARRSVPISSEGLPGAMPIVDEPPVAEAPPAETELQGAIKAVEALLEMPGGAAQIQSILLQQKAEAEAQSSGAQ